MKRTEDYYGGYSKIIPKFCINIADRKIFNFIKNQVDAEEVMAKWLEYACTQQALFDQKLKYKSQAQVNKALLIRANGAILDYLEKKNNRESIITKKSLSLLFDDGTSEIIYFNLDSAIQFIIDKVDDKNSLMAYACIVRGKSYREISYMLDRPPSTLKDQVKKFRAQLKKLVLKAIFIFQIEDTHLFYTEFQYRLLTLREVTVTTKT